MIMNIEWPIAFAFTIFIGIITWPDKPWRERLVLLIIPLFAVMASFADDQILQTIFLVGTIALIVSHIRPEQASSLLEKNMKIIYIVLSGGLLVTSLALYDKNLGINEAFITLVGGITLIVFTFKGSLSPRWYKSTNTA